MCGPSGDARAQGVPKAPPGPPPREPLKPEPWDSVMQGLKEIEDPNPERFKPREPLFPKSPVPPGRSNDPTEDEKKRKEDERRAAPYYGS